jgi:hypothetical protein
MKRAIWKVILLASVLGMATAVSSASAGEKGKKPDAVKPEPVVVAEPLTEAVEDPVYEKRRFGSLKPREIKEKAKAKWESRTPIGCYGHFNDYSCNSFHSTVQFLFGSCRSFYGEACLKGPPPSPVPGFDPYALGVDRRGNGRCPGCR